MTATSHTQGATGDVPALRRRLAADLEAARARTRALTHDVFAADDADFTRQHSPLMSPFHWDVAHIANMEDYWLVRRGAPDTEETAGVREDLDQYYDAFTNPRAGRPQLPLLEPRRGAGLRRPGAREGPRPPRGRGVRRAPHPGRGLRVRHDRPARAAARGDDAGHPPAARRGRRCCTPTRRRASVVPGLARHRDLPPGRGVPDGRRPTSRSRWTTRSPRTPCASTTSGSTPPR